MSRIAFVSCVRIPYTDDFDNDPPCKLDASAFDQPVWDHLLEQHVHMPFDAMLFLGDQVYSDYAIENDLHDFGGKRPRHWTPDRFHRLMDKMYRAQYAVPSFQKLLDAFKSKVAIGAIWDDHDFGYNNGGGEDKKFQNKINSSRLLFTEFVKALNAYPAPYSARPGLPSELPVSQVGIEQIDTPICIGDDIEIVLLDGRMHRAHHAYEGAPLLGEAQWKKLHDKLVDWPKDKLLIVCLGSTYSISAKYGADQSWYQGGRSYAHFDEFTKLAKDKHIVFLGGDIHTNEFVSHNGFCEVISSGAHTPDLYPGHPLLGQPNQHRFGILDIDATQVHVKLFANNKIESDKSKTISRATGLPI
jgi:PhoD-like phosphatase